MKYELAYDFLISKLELELPEHLRYHDVLHTKSVINEVILMAGTEGVSGDELVLLKTAALFHDSGFLYSKSEHETYSCKIAREHLPAYDYTPAQIDTVCNLIMATKLPQSPYDKSSKILCDADLYYLGNSNYADQAGKLYEEMKRTGSADNMEEWRMKQVHFLTSHNYFTNTANKNQNKGKQINLEKLKSASTGLKAPAAKQESGVFIDIIYVLSGVLIMGIALKCFLVPNHFFDGGVTGISLLIHEIYHVNLTLAIIVLNIPFILIGSFIVNKQFALRTLISVILLGICLVILPSFSATSDKLLISIFGGAFLGIGVGLVMRAGAAIDGIEVLALYTLRRTSFTITEIILGINIIIFAIAGFKFGIETALYSIITYFTATRTIDFVVEGLEAYTGVTIISGKSELIKYDIVNTLGRGITIYKGERGFLPGNYHKSEDCDIIFTVITRMELRKLKNLVNSIDPNAFIFVNTIKETKGGIINKKNRH